MGAVLSGIASVVGIAGGVATAVGQVSQGRASSSAEQFNASVSRANAQAVRVSADLDIARQRRQAESFKSTQRAGYAKAGVKYEGSPLDVMIDSAAQLEMDSIIMDYNARTQMSQLSQQAQQSERAADVYKRKGYLKGAGTLLSTFAPFALKSSSVSPIKPAPSKWARNV